MSAVFTQKVRKDLERLNTSINGHCYTTRLVWYSCSWPPVLFSSGI